MGNWSVVLGNNFLMSETLESTISASGITIKTDSIPIYPAPLGDFDGMLMIDQAPEIANKLVILAIGGPLHKDVTPCSQLFSLKSCKMSKCLKMFHCTVHQSKA